MFIIQVMGDKIEIEKSATPELFLVCDAYLTTVQPLLSRISSKMKSVSARMPTALPRNCVTFTRTYLEIV